MNPRHFGSCLALAGLSLLLRAEGGPAEEQAPASAEASTSGTVTAPAAEAPRPLNRLLAADSPHLREHADSPVEWREWGPDAFAEAKRSGRPVFVTVGYLTCHWCSLMDRESFRQPAVVEALNTRAIPVRVDRYERPDLDRLFVRYADGVKQRSGWPMNVWLTSQGTPFRCTSYLPPRD